MVAGSRSIHVDVEWYKQIACRAEIFPCWDSWHTSDACHWMDDAFYRGVIANRIAQGADGVVGFNYMSAPPEILMRVIKAEDIYESKKDSTVPYANFADFARQFRDAFRPELPRTYSAERRGGYPYRTGMGGENLTAPLPAALPNDGSVCEVPVPVLQDYSGRSVQLRLLISNAKEECDRFRMFCNGRELTNVQTNFRYVDPQIFWPEPQPYSGGNYCYASNPSPLLLLSAEVDGALLKNGENLLGVSVIDRVNYWLDCDAICVERAEITGNAD